MLFMCYVVLLKQLEDLVPYPQEAAFGNGCSDFGTKTSGDWGLMTNLQ
jgi:hypothetical protein